MTQQHPSINFSRSTTGLTKMMPGQYAKMPGSVVLRCLDCKQLFRINTNEYPVGHNGDMSATVCCPHIACNFEAVIRLLFWT